MKIKAFHNWSCVAVWTCCLPVFRGWSKWATSWENLFIQYANNKGAYQPAHPHSLISAIIVRCLDSITPLVSISGTSSLYLASVAVQASLCLTWLQTPKTGFILIWLIYHKKTVAVIILKLEEVCLKNVILELASCKNLPVVRTCQLQYSWFVY